MEAIEIDGSAGEGGGQILRTALALSMCTGRPVALYNIRARRPKPGLMRQHLTCVQAAKEVCMATVAGAEPGSQRLLFEPGPVRAGDYECNVGTAGSCTLVLQTVLPALMLAAEPSRVVLSGGTHNPMAPPFHFLERSFAPPLASLGIELELDLRRHGFYPAGGGEMVARIRPAPSGLTPFDLTARGALREEYAECLAAGISRQVAVRELAALQRAFGWSDEQLRALGPHLADQWTLPLAFAVAQRGGAAAFTCSETTEHLMTNIGMIERFLPVKFGIEAAGSAARVQVASLAGA